MRIQYNDDGSIDAYIRQSWLKEVTMCPERGRNGIVRGDWNIANELTAIGTAVHAGAEAKLTGLTDPLDGAMAKWAQLLTEPMRWVKYNQMQAEAQIRQLCAEWEKDLYPQVAGRIPSVDRVEWNFNFLLDEFQGFFPGKDGDLNYRTVRVNGKGTCDVVAEDEAWDWKTSTRKYNVKEKQNNDVQSTMYAAAAVAAGHLEWPVTFKFGVMVRGGGTQVVEVYRDESHYNWIKHMVRPIVRQTLTLGTDEPWQMNDTGYLCNETWCSFWSVCKGAMV